MLLHGLRRLRAVGHMILIREKNKLLLWQGAARLVEHRQAADTRIKNRNFHPNRPP